MEQLNTFYEACIIAKHNRKPFQKETIRRTRELLKVVHSDIYRPLSVQSFGKNNYLITFMDDFCKKIWIKLLKQKSKALKAFKDIKCMVKKVVW